MIKPSGSRDKVNELVHRKPGLTSKQISEQLDIPFRTVTSALRKLLETNDVSRIGLLTDARLKVWVPYRKTK